jgi:hypothetical protein
MTDRADILKTTINDFRYTYKVIDSEKKKKNILEEAKGVLRRNKDKNLSKVNMYS